MRTPRNNVVGLLLGLAAGLGLFVAITIRTKNSKIDFLEQENAAVTASRDAMSRRISSLEADLEATRREFGVFRSKAIVSDEHSLFEDAEQSFRASQWSQAKVAYEAFVAHYPSSAMASNARDRLRTVIKQLADVEKKDREEEVTASLNSVRVAEIYAHIERFKGKTIARNVECHAIETAFAMQGDFQSNCTVDSILDSRVLYRSRDVKLLAGLPRSEAGFFSYKGVFKILDQEVEGSGIVLKFQSLAN